MKLTLRRPECAVYDDVLPKPKSRLVADYAQNEATRSVHSDGYQRVWKVDDGTPLGGLGCVARLERRAGRTALREGGRPWPGDRFYPTGSAIDLVLAALLWASEDLRPWVGEAGTAWDALAARLFHYPAGSGLSWHTDDYAYVGAFVYYVDVPWEPLWGGELLLGVPLAGRRRPGRRAFAREGIFLCPRPNRLVVLKGGVHHKIGKVSAACGHRFRTSIAGFFMQRGWYDRKAPK